MTEAERVLGMALSRAMQRDWDEDDAVERLTALGPARLSIAIALAKVRRSQFLRPGPIGERAERVLALALARIEGAKLTATA